MDGRTTKTIKMPPRIISTKWTIVRRGTSFGGARRGKAAAGSIEDIPHTEEKRKKVATPTLAANIPTQNHLFRIVLYLPSAFKAAHWALKTRPKPRGYPVWNPNTD